jgi:hypothetical protein
MKLKRPVETGQELNYSASSSFIEVAQLVRAQFPPGFPGKNPGFMGCKMLRFGDPQDSVLEPNIQEFVEVKKKKTMSAKILNFPRWATTSTSH